MKEFKPNYCEYIKILEAIKNSGKYCDYSEALHKNEFIVLRHDIEFSIARAFALSEIETLKGINATYFVQITNNSYNTFSKKNLDLLHKMINNGHHIGLHYHCNGNFKQEDIIAGIKKEIAFLNMMLGNGYKVDRFSVHRPSVESKYWQIEIPGLFNAYGKDFFSYCENVSNETVVEIKYIADSKHRWNYGYPDLKTLMNNKKIQLLIHPFSWTENGFNNENNFKSLIDEKSFELMDTFSAEFKRYKECEKTIRNEYELKKLNYYTI